ncbi:MAG: hypothetical protein M3160_04970 [Candidatus Eremiobacteraeota bacterium]|nr:hypothetical protein [Candidatus Eremiobacteraeota bacterium]
MRRTLITGAVCLAAGYVAAAALPDITKDIGRYNRMRAMSNQGTLLNGVLENLPALGAMAFQAFNGKRDDSNDGNSKARGGTRTSILSLIPDLGKDIARYKKIRAM